MKDTVKTYANDVTTAIAGGSISAVSMQNELLIIAATLLAPIVKKLFEAAVDSIITKLKNRKVNVQ